MIFENFEIENFENFEITPNDSSKHVITSKKHFKLFELQVNTTISANFGKKIIADNKKHKFLHFYYPSKFVQLFQPKIRVSPVSPTRLTTLS